MTAFDIPPASALSAGLIVNADDLAIHPDINSGILSAYRNGILTSCTMLMTTPYRERTVRDFVRPALLPIGIHLSLTLGKAAAPSDQVPDLVDEQGNLKLSADRLLLSSFKGPNGQSLISQIRREFAAQLALARDFGLQPTHADSHQHVHMNPAIFKLLEDLLPRYGVTRLRYSKERLYAFACGPDLPTLLKRNNPPKWALLRWRSSQLRPHLATNDEFFGVLYSGAMTKRALLALLARMPTNRSLEICIHPGFPASKAESVYPRPGYNEFISSAARKVEHDILVDPEVEELVRRRGLTLRAFNGRAKS
jgi:predicted glycoside hydrolase/deacetylase ChbG (UPF0249 family)